MSDAIYSWDDIRAAGDCQRFMEEVLGAVSVGRRSGEDRRYNCPWRNGSDSEALAVTREAWFDHVAKEGGGLLDLCARAKFAGNLFQAGAFLGQWLHLTPRMKAARTRRIVKVYDYTDLLGLVVHQTVRYEPKDFAQRRPDPEREGQFIYNLDGIQPVLYRWGDWHDKPMVFLVEGEKDADTLAELGLPATTSPMGAGKWCQAFTDALKGKAVAILPDNDAPGHQHAELVASSIHGAAKAVCIVDLPGLPEKGDVSDWVAAGHTAEELRALVKAAPRWKPGHSTVKDAPRAMPDGYDIQKAKTLNRIPFRNFRWETAQGDGGRDEDIRRPIHIEPLRNELFDRFLGFPRMVGDTLFDHERKTGRIRFIQEPAEMMAWVSEKSEQLVEWARIEGAVSQDQFMATVRANTRRYQTVSGIPCWPPRDDVYYTHGQLPAPIPGAPRLNEFLALFNPDEDADAILLRAFFATPLYYRLGVHKPLMVVDSASGQGSGKTTLVSMLAMLYGGDDPECATPITIEPDELTNVQQSDRVRRRLLSTSGRQKRIFLADNVEGYFRSSSLAKLLTESVITGMAPYGKGEENRPNDLTYCMTVNSATLSRDLIHRAVFIHVRPPDATDGARVGWSRRVHAFIRKHRLQIIADMIGLLEAGPQFEFVPVSRFADWEHDLMAPMCGSMEAYSAAWAAIRKRREQSDGDVEEAEAIRAHFIERLTALGCNPETRPCWIQSDVLKRWCQEAVPGYGGRDGRGAIHHLRNLVKVGMIPELSSRGPEKYPARGSDRRRGMMWLMDLHESPDYEGYTAIAKLDGDVVRLA